MITEYNDLIEKIVKEFATRYYKELFNEDDPDYRLIDYEWINFWPLEISDEYYSIDDMLMTIKYDIPLKLVSEYYNKWLEAHLDNKELWINLYNYYLKNKYN